jgi:hypothetical protein
MSILTPSPSSASIELHADKLLYLINTTIITTIIIIITITTTITITITITTMQVKMLTGDHLLIAREMARKLEFGDVFYSSEVLPVLDGATKQKPTNLKDGWGDLILGRCASLLPDPTCSDLSLQDFLATCHMLTVPYLIPTSVTFRLTNYRCRWVCTSMA